MKNKKTKVKNKSKEVKSMKEAPIRFPASVLKPVSVFFKKELAKLEHRKKELEKEDPFSDEARISDNAALDTEAEEQFSHARTSAIREQIERRIIQVRKTLTRIKIGKYGICENCGNMIDTDRLMVYPEATRCIKCENKK